MKIQRGERWADICHGCGRYAPMGILQVVDIEFKNGRAEIIMGALCSDNSCRKKAEDRLQRKIDRLGFDKRVRIQSIRQAVGDFEQITLKELKRAA